MRTQINKLKRHSSTKAERRFLEILKRNHISFQTKTKIDGREIDFIVGDYAIEIDSHRQDSKKNWMLIKRGYTPMHYTSWDVNSPILEAWLKQIHGRIRT